MRFERFDIIAIVLSKGHLPSTWWRFEPTFVDVAIFIGTIGFFFVLFLLYARTFPVIAQAEVKTILKSSGEHYKKLAAEGKHGYNKGANVPKVTPSPKTTETSTTDDDSANTNTLLDKIGRFDPSTQSADDLKVISGVGPKLEGVLNTIGIYTYLQVSKMTKTEYDLLDSITKTFPGRAERDDWSAQAKNLLNG